jgi:parallel beta-helix repeat protein
MPDRHQPLALVQAARPQREEPHSRQPVHHTRGNAIQIAPGTAQNTISDNVITSSAKNGIILSGERQIVKGNHISSSGLKNLAVEAGSHEISP